MLDSEKTPMLARISALVIPFGTRHIVVKAFCDKKSEKNKTASSKISTLQIIFGMKVFY